MTQSSYSIALKIGQVVVGMGLALSINGWSAASQAQGFHDSRASKHSVKEEVFGGVNGISSKLKSNEGLMGMLSKNKMFTPGHSEPCSITLFYDEFSSLPNKFSLDGAFQLTVTKFGKNFEPISEDRYELDQILVGIPLVENRVVSSQKVDGLTVQTITTHQNYSSLWENLKPNDQEYKLTLLTDANGLSLMTVDFNWKMSDDTLVSGSSICSVER